MTTTVWSQRSGKALKGEVGDHDCELCGKPIKGEGHWLEVSIDGYVMDASAPGYDPDQSQGSFRFGPDCRRRLLASSTSP